MYWLWLSKTKRSNDLKADTTAMAKAKDESQDHGSHDQSHDKATAKTLRLSKPKSITMIHVLQIEYYNTRELHVRCSLE
jgi:hypothetical protein